MNWTMLDTWIVVAGGLSALSCALLGCFLVLRRMSMMGDAISHAVLPGLAIAFLITGSRESLPMLIGAAVLGVLTAVLTQFVHRLGRVEASASMGVVFTSLFALGLVLIVRAADHVDLDPGCVLYGSVETVILDMNRVFGFEIPRAVVVLGVVFIANGAIVLSLFKEFRISSFDPALATTQGINASFMHYLLMSLVAVTTVASFESVGSILVIAMLIVPAAAAHLLTDRLNVMIILSLVIAAASALLGHIGAITVPTWFGFSDTVTAGMMAVVAGVIFAITMLAAPRHGLVSKLVHRFNLTQRIAREDLLGLLYRLDELQVSEPTARLLDRLRSAIGLGAFGARLALATLRRAGQVEPINDSHRLTPAGRRAAGNLIRSHRLWETYLVEHAAIKPDHVHDAAMRLEHATSPSMQQRLAARTEHAARDPHGRAIPIGPDPQAEADAAPGGR